MQLLGVMDIFDFVLIYFSKICPDIFIFNANESAECVESKKTLLPQQKYITGYFKHSDLKFCMCDVLQPKHVDFPFFF